MTFPKNFKWGVADADLQVIGEQYTLKHENSLPTMWTYGAQHSGKVYNNETPLEGINRYELWEQDIDFLVKLGVKHYRTSVSMARILNENMTVNMKAIEWYKTYFAALREKGITIYVTLYHWELPQFVSERGGWANKLSIDFLLAHSLAVYEYLNEYIEEYFIINEHINAIFLSYHWGMHAPFETDLQKALLAGHNMLVAQGKVFRELKKKNTNLKISTVYNLTPVYAHTTQKEDILAQQYSFAYSTYWFLDPIYTGKYPEPLLSLYKDQMPEISDEEMELIRIGPELESLGINYYFGQTVVYDEENEIKSKDVYPQMQVVNGLNWPVYVPPTYPEGLYDLLIQVNARYQIFGLKKIYITENGTAWKATVDQNGEVDDSFRIEYITAHLAQVNKAIRAGVPICGYFLWTFMDNYEWQEGYRSGSEFGIVYVDRKTLKRIPKKSYYWYKDFVKKEDHEIE